MTAKERVEIQNHINLFTELDSDRDRAFYALQDLNVECGDGIKWCGPDSNLRGVIKNGNDAQIDRALWLYRQYFEASGKRDLLSKLGQALADLGFWKSK